MRYRKESSICMVASSIDVAHAYDDFALAQKLCAGQWIPQIVQRFCPHVQAMHQFIGAVHSGRWLHLLHSIILPHAQKGSVHLLVADEQELRSFHRAMLDLALLDLSSSSRRRACRPCRCTPLRACSLLSAQATDENVHVGTSTKATAACGREALLPSKFRPQRQRKSELQNSATTGSSALWKSPQTSHHHSAC